MGSYYEHKRREKIELPYSFQCEQCGKDSGSMVAVISGVDATYNSHFKTVSDAREEKLRQQAHKYLVKEIKNVHKNIVEKQIYPEEFHDNCPFCHQPQSWAVSGLKQNMYQNPICCLAAGAFFAVILVFCHYFGDMEYVPLSVAAGIFGVGVVAAIGCLIWNIRKINLKTQQTASGAQHVPVIAWGAVQHLLDEQ